MYRTNKSQLAATKLLRYFARPRIAALKALLYTEYYEKYCLYPMASNITRNSACLHPNDLLEIPYQPFPQQIIRLRSRGEVVARIRTVPPQTGELFYLCALLLHKSAFSFEDLQFLFCQLLLNLPMNAIPLFNLYQEQLIADYLDQFGSAELATDLALRDLERYLNTQSSKLADFGLPQPEQQSSLLQLEQASCSRQYTDLTMKY
ncbi:hypothetical protein L873DRAFT_1841541 [Choiromyces venosus 120613-1]|uniref:Uncharacterized protein n=1 Tax=Choiromyces venosus 120613-1 TaxID=1336337 RepID=A0A3N4K118_9PEZI|nr:hypothetical protein L873DRAFT_1841541 [Choiromyces venosus 120613-1]